MITDGGRTVIETGAIIDYIIRHHGAGRMQPDPNSADYDAYVQWLHYGEGSAMLPLMLHMYVGRLKEAGAPLHPRIQSEVANHLGFIDGLPQRSRILCRRRSEWRGCADELRCRSCPRAAVAAVLSRVQCVA